MNALFNELLEFLDRQTAFLNNEAGIHGCMLIETAAVEHKTMAAKLRAAMEVTSD